MLEENHYMKELLYRLWTSDIVRFVIVGGCSTLLDFFCYMYLQTHCSIVLAKLVAMLLASVFSYIVNKIFTFQFTDNANVQQIVKFYLVFIINITVNVFVNWWLFCTTGYKLLAYVCATLAGMIVNYSGQKYFVFNNKKK